MDLLKKIMTLENDAENFGFAWENPHQIMEQIESECAEIKTHLQAGIDANRTDLQEEIGDLLHAVFSLTVFCKLDPQITLQQTIEKFERRLNAVKQIAKEKGLSDLHQKSFDELMMIWKEAKQRVG